MLEGLTIIVLATALTGAIIFMTRDGSVFIGLTGLMLFFVGVTALLAVAKDHYPQTSTLEWLYQPLSEVPSWLIVVNLVLIVVLLVAIIFTLVDDLVHLPRRKGGNR